MQELNEAVEEFSVSIDGPGVKIEKKVAAPLASAIMGMLMTGKLTSVAGAGIAAAKPPMDSVGNSGDGGDGSKRRVALREFLDDHDAKRNPDKITAIGRYIEEFENKQSFTKEEVKLKFRTAGEAPPGNYMRDFNWAVHSGWIAADPSLPDEFFVTNKGRTAIAAKFSRDVQKPAPGESGRRRTKKRNGDGEDLDTGEAVPE